MERIITFPIMATPGLAADTAFANNWQWQLDQIKAEATEANPIAIPPVK